MTFFILKTHFYSKRIFILAFKMVQTDPDGPPVLRHGSSCNSNPSPPRPFGKERIQMYVIFFWRNFHHCSMPCLVIQQEKNHFTFLPLPQLFQFNICYPCFSHNMWVLLTSKPFFYNTSKGKCYDLF